MTQRKAKALYSPWIITEEDTVLEISERRHHGTGEWTTTLTYFWACENCKRALEGSETFCPECGREIDWSECYGSKV